MTAAKDGPNTQRTLRRIRDFRQRAFSLSRKHRHLVKVPSAARRCARFDEDGKQSPIAFHRAEPPDAWEDFQPGTAGDLALPIVEGDEDTGTQRERRRDVQNIQRPREGAGGIFCGEFPGFVENCEEIIGTGDGLIISSDRALELPPGGVLLSPP